MIRNCGIVIQNRKVQSTKQKLKKQQNKFKKQLGENIRQESITNDAFSK